MTPQHHNFNSLKEAVAYVEKCPCCQSPIMGSFDISDFVEKGGKTFVKLAWGNSWNSWNDVILKLGYDNNQLLSIDYCDKLIIYDPSFNFMPKNMENYNYELYFSCYDCKGFNFTMEISYPTNGCYMISLKEETLTRVFDDDWIYRMRTNYDKDTTSFLAYSSLMKPTTLDLPLTPINLDTFNYTMNRFKKLISFQ